MAKRTIDTPDQAQRLLRDWKNASDWMDDNQHIVDISIRQCHRWVSEGHGEAWGVSGLYERLRWVIRVKAENPKDGPNLNNDMKPYLARWVMYLHPELEGMFELNYCPKSRADEWLIWKTTGVQPSDVTAALEADDGHGETIHEGAAA